MKKIDVIDITIRAQVEQLKKDLSFREKLSIAKNLEKMGVDAIELPSVLLNKEECVVCRTISESVNNVTVCLDAGTNAQTVYDCIKIANSKRMQVILPVSTVQMEYSYHAKAPKMLEKIGAMVKSASEFGAEVEFVAKDASRAEQGFVVSCAKVAKENGAKIITLSDDAGVYFPDQFASLVAEVKKACDIKVYVEPSNQLKMGVSMAIEVVKAGADGIKTAIGIDNLIAPNDFASALRVKADELGVTTNLDFTSINKTVKDVMTFSCEEDVNDQKTLYKDKISLDKECSVKDIQNEIIALGYDLSVEDVSKVYAEFERVVSKKDAIGERELEAIIASTAMQVPSTFHLERYVVNSGNIITATANVTLVKDGEELSGVSTGDGPIDAAFHAIEQIIGHHYELDDFNVQAVTKGREAVGSAVIRLRAEGKLYSGNGVSTDIVGACIRAYINALNKIVYGQK